MGFNLTNLFGGGESAGTNISPDQLPFLKDLWGQAQGQLSNTSGQQYAQSFQQPSLNSFNTLAGGGNMIPGLQQGYENFGAQSNDALQGSIDAGLGQINRNLQRNILPSISANSAMTGTSGGSRAGIAEGLAMSDANQQATDFTNNMMSNNWQQQMQNQYAGLQGQSGMIGQQNRSMTGALTQAPNLSNLGFNSQYGNLNQYGSLLGSPVTTGGGSTTYGQMFSPMKLY